MSTDQMENELLVRIKNADHHAFKLVFDQYVEKVYHYIYGYLKNRQLAEDNTQEVFKKLWEKRAVLDESKTLQGFLFKLCYHQVIDSFRADKIKIAHAISNEDALQEQITADNHIQYRQLESLYQQALNELPPKRKEVFVLSRHEGLSNKEIATRLSISIKTVENQMTSSLHFIRDFFHKAGHVIIVIAFSWWNMFK